jgi:hypothetical protein
MLWRLLLQMYILACAILLLSTTTKTSSSIFNVENSVAYMYQLADVGSHSVIASFDQQSHHER